MKTPKEEQVKLSWQARLYKHTARSFVRPLLQPGVDFENMRRRIKRLEKGLSFFERGYTRSQTSLAGLACHTITTPLSRSDHLILYFHGGGFCLRSPATHGQLLGKMCRLAEATGLMPEYRLAPEHPFPTAYEDCIAIYQSVLEKGYTPEKMVFAGDSAGGALTMGTLLQARDAGLPLPAGAVLISAGLGAMHITGIETTENSKDAVLSPKGVQAFSQAWAAHKQPEHPLAVLLNCDFSNLPPLLFQVGGEEMLLEDAIQGAQKAKEAGVQAELQIYPGMPHVFQIFGVMPEARRAIDNMATFIQACWESGR